MFRLPIRPLAAITCALIGALFLVQIVAAQTAPLRVVQASDATVYLVVGSIRYTVMAEPISDDDLAALTDGGSLESDFTSPVVATAPVIPTPVPPVPPFVPTVSPPQPLPPEQPVILSGTGNEVGQTTRVFPLHGGNYAVSWSGSAKAGPMGFGNVSFALKASDNPSESIHILVNDSVKVGETKSGTTNVDSLPGGQYYVVALIPGAWKVTITPR